MQHFLKIDALSLDTVHQLIDRAEAFKRGSRKCYADYRLVTLFYENSTRTRISFELAAHHLSIPVVHFDNAASSEKKGESFEDTLANLQAMGLHLFVMRHSQEDFFHTLVAKASPAMHIINAGDGKNEHPSQAMLDLMTICAHKPKAPSLKIAIVGNISHSRVAHSLMALFQLVGVGDLVLVAPKMWQPEALPFGRVTDSLDEGLKDADVVICLRIQKERLLSQEHIDLLSYKQNFSVTCDRLAIAKPDVAIMHPGPINRGLELTSEVADSKHSLILEQVTNGVFMRMAIIDALLSKT